MNRIYFNSPHIDDWYWGTDTKYPADITNVLDDIFTDILDFR